MVIRTLWAREQRNAYSNRWHTLGYADTTKGLTARFGRCGSGDRNVLFTRVTPMKGGK